jgi:tetratricopeptide (TPR) repeat protein
LPSRPDAATFRGVRLPMCVLLFSIAMPRPSAAQDDVLAGYQRFNRGDIQGARREFGALLEASPGRLAARFGLLEIVEHQIGVDPALEPEFEKQIDAFIADAEARYYRSDKDEEALFYLANAYLLRASYRLDHDKGTWAAARDGARSKRYIDAYVKRRPEHGDAYFALGTYNYYVEIAPTFIKLIRPLLFLPSGDRPGGLKQLERAYTQGSLFAFRAGQRLMEIYGTFEGRPADGIRVGEQLAAKYPENPDVRFDLAELYGGPAVGDYAKAAAQYEAVTAAESRRPQKRAAFYRAQIGLASTFQERWRFEDAIGVLGGTIALNPSDPDWVMPVFLQRRANYRALAGDPGAAEDVKRVLADPKWTAQHKSADGLLKWMTARSANGEAAIYASLVRGNRLAVEKRWEDAAAAYETVRRQHPADPQVRYRLAALRFARGDAIGAAADASPLAADRAAPTWIRAQSLLIVAQSQDLAGQRDEAKKTYQRIVDDFEHESAAWRARVGLLTPYRRP